MRLWLQGPGSRFRNHDPSSGPTYLGRGNGAVFPLNPTFRSEPVLDEEARELVWSKIVERGESIKAVSAELGIDMRRVAAVVRLKEVEKGWIAQASSPYFFCFFFVGGMGKSSLRDEHNSKIRLVLKTATHGYKIALRASLIQNFSLSFLSSCLRETPDS